jgi:hypothetical protein
MPRSAGVTISAVVVIIGSALTLLGGAMVIFFAIVLSKTSQVADIPGSFAAIEVIEGVMFFGFGGWGLASGIGLIGLKSWARISLLVFAGILVLVSLPAVAIIPFVPLPNTNAADLPANFMSIVRVGIVLFYAAFAALGGFWLYFFNKRSVTVQFGVQQPTAESATPGMTFEPPMDAISANRGRPLSITIIGWYLLITSAFAGLWLPLAGRLFSGTQLPMYLLGRFFFGRSAYAIFIVWMLAQALAAVGILKLKRAGLFATIALQCLALVNAALLVVIPGTRARYQQIMDGMMATMTANMPQLTVHNGSTSTPFYPFRFPAWAATVAAVPIVVVVLWFLITRRQVFLSSGAGLTNQRS